MLNDTEAMDLVREAIFARFSHEVDDQEALSRIIVVCEQSGRPIIAEIDYQASAANDRG